MKTPDPKGIKKEITTSSTAHEYRYLAETVKNFEFADWVKVRSSPSGMLFSFGKSHPDNQEFMVFFEVLLPIHIAHSLGRIIIKQMDELQKKGYVKFENDDEDK